MATAQWAALAGNRRPVERAPGLQLGAWASCRPSRFQTSHLNSILATIGASLQPCDDFWGGFDIFFNICSRKPKSGSRARHRIPFRGAPPSQAASARAAVQVLELVALSCRSQPTAFVRPRQPFVSSQTSRPELANLQIAFDTSHWMVPAGSAPLKLYRN